MAFPDPIVSGEVLIPSGMRSDNYVDGVSGWRIGKDGTAQFTDIVLDSSSVDLQSSNYVPDHAGWAINSDGSAQFSDVEVTGQFYTARSGRRMTVGVNVTGGADPSDVSFFNADSTTTTPGTVGPYSSGSQSAMAMISPRNSSETYTSEVDVISGSPTANSQINLSADEVFAGGACYLGSSTNLVNIAGNLNLPGQGAISYAGSGSNQNMAASTWSAIVNYVANFTDRGGVSMSHGVVTVTYGGLYMFLGQWSMPAGLAAGTELQGRFIDSNGIIWGQNLNIVSAHSTVVNCITFLPLNPGDTVTWQGWCSVASPTNNTSQTQALACFRFG